MLFPRGSHASDYGNMESNTASEWEHFVQYFPAPKADIKHINLSSGVFFLMMIPRAVSVRICTLKMSNHAGLVEDRPSMLAEVGGGGGVNCTYLLLRRFVKLFISFAGFY